MDLQVQGRRRGITNLLGPYETWMFGPGKAYDLHGLQLADQACLSCVAEFPGAPTMFRLQSTAAPLPGRPRYTLPVLYTPQGFTPSFVPFLMTTTGEGTPPLDRIEAIGDALANVVAVCGAGDTSRGYFRLNYPVRTETLDPDFPGEAADAPAEPDPSVDPARPIVIVAVIDDGIPFAHDAFRHGGGTRIDYCWSQGATGPGNGAVPFGREFTRDAINRMAERHGRDEDAIYREAGLLGRPGVPPMPLDLPESHGAHVLGLAAGDWPDADAAQVRVIAVDLPPTSTWETSGFGTDMFILSAFHYIFDRAARIAAAHGRPDGLPVVVNLSFGYSGGPHDRSGLLEAAMDELVLARRAVGPTLLVLPSGNSFQDRLSALIGDADFRPGPDGASERAELCWSVPACDGTSTYLELWYPPGTKRPDIRVDVLPPGRTAPANTSAVTVQESGRFAASDIVVDGAIVGQFAVEKHRDSRWRVSVILAPTEPRARPPGTRHAEAPAGDWTIRLLRPRGARMPQVHLPDGRAVRGAVQCRVQIDTASLQGNTGARQSAFVSASYQPTGPDGAAGESDASGPVRRFGNLNGLAATRTGLIVAGHDQTTGRAAAYSGAGAQRDLAGGTGAVPFDRQVDLSAPTDRSPSKQGIVSTGTRSGIRAEMRGTSVAAPQAARRLAEALLAGGTLQPGDETGLSLLLARGPAVGDPVPPGGQRARLGQLRLHPLRNDG